MTERDVPKDRQRRVYAYVALGVGLVNLILGVAVGAAITIGVAVFLLVVGGALLVSAAGTGNPPPSA